MKLSAVVVLFAFLGGSLASVAIGNYKHPDHPGKCFALGVEINPGEVRKFSATEGNCCEVYCGESDDDGMYYSCYAQGTSPGCKLGERIEPDSVYPACCKKHVICPEDME